MPRHQYRLSRNLGFEPYRNTSTSLRDLAMELRTPKKCTLYSFKHSFLTSCTFDHFQLRNMVCAASKNCIFYANYHKVKLWNPLLKSSLTFFDEIFRISTLCCSNDLLCIGGFKGEYLVKNIFSKKIEQGRCTSDPMGICNQMELTTNPSGSNILTIASNDKSIIKINLCSLKKTIIPMPWEINCATLSPSKRILAAVGDSCNGLLLDSNGIKIGVLEGHLDYSFACAFSPNGLHLATGNQDLSVRIYDLRNFKSSLCVLGANIGGVRSIRYTPDGCLCYAEDADMVTIVDPHLEYSQTIDFFGEISGIAFTPDAESLFIGNSDSKFGALMEFSSRRPITFLKKLKYI